MIERRWTERVSLQLRMMDVWCAVLGRCIESCSDLFESEDLDVSTVAQLRQDDALALAVAVAVAVAMQPARWSDPRRRDKLRIHRSIQTCLPDDTLWGR